MQHVKNKVLSIYCVIYGLLVLYGSLMPFDLVNSSQTAWKNLCHAIDDWPVGPFAAVGKPDLISNILLYVPLGVLVSTRLSLGGKSEPRRRGRKRSFSAALLAMVLGAAISVTVEFLQAFSQVRVSSLTDVTNNTVGSLLGGLFGCLWGRSLWIAGRRRVRLLWRANGCSAVALLLGGLLLLDALFPYLPTLDVSEVKRHLKQTLGLMGTLGFETHDWHYWLVSQAAPYAVLAILLACGTFRARPGRWWRGIFFSILLAGVAEVGKVFITSRFANPANVIAAAGGALIAPAIAWSLQGAFSRRRTILLAGGLAALYVVYLEWEPFTFVWDPAEMSSLVPKGAQWLPLYHYAMAGRGEQVHLLVRTLVLLGTVGFCLQLSVRRLETLPPWRRACLVAAFTGAIGLVLELGQFFVPGRIPSVTDVFCFAAGGLVGSIVATLHLRRRQETQQPQEPKRPRMALTAEELTYWSRRTGR